MKKKAGSSPNVCDLIPLLHVSVKHSKRAKELVWASRHTEGFGWGLISDLLGVFAPLRLGLCAPSSAEPPYLLLQGVLKWQE